MLELEFSHEKEEVASEGERAAGWRAATAEGGFPNWEERGYTRQFLQEWQTKELRHTENRRARKPLKTQDQFSAVSMA
jgi:hypothetical protein